MERNELMEHLAKYRQNSGLIDTRAMLRDFDANGVDALLLVYGPAPENRMYTEAYELFEAAEDHNEEVKRANIIADVETLARANRAANWLLPALAMLVSFVLTLVPIVGWMVI